MASPSSLTLDASIVIAVENPQDAHHDAALSLLDEACDVPWVMHPLTITELLVGAARHGSPDTAPARIARYREWLSELGVEAMSDTAAAELSSQDSCDEIALLRARTGLKLPNCIVLRLAVHERSALATADRRLAAAAEAEGVLTLMAAPSAS